MKRMEFICLGCYHWYSCERIFAHIIWMRKLKLIYKRKEKQKHYLDAQHMTQSQTHAKKRNFKQGNSNEVPWCLLEQERIACYYFPQLERSVVLRLKLALRMHCLYWWLVPPHPWHTGSNLADGQSCCLCPCPWHLKHLIRWSGFSMHSLAKCPIPSHLKHFRFLRLFCCPAPSFWGSMGPITDFNLFSIVLKDLSNFLILASSPVVLMRSMMILKKSTLDVSRVEREIARISRLSYFQFKSSKELAVQAYSMNSNYLWLRLVLWHS